MRHLFLYPHFWDPSAQSPSAYHPDYSSSKHNMFILCSYDRHTERVYSRKHPIFPDSHKLILSESIVTLVTRSAVIAADALVLVLTWMKTFKNSREARQLGIKSPLPSLLLRDGWFFFYYYDHTMILISIDRDYIFLVSLLKRCPGSFRDRIYLIDRALLAMNVAQILIQSIVRKPLSFRSKHLLKVCVISSQALTNCPSSQYS